MGPASGPVFLLCFPGHGLRNARQVKVLQPGIRNLAHALQAGLLKGAVQSGILQKLGEDPTAALFRIGHVMLPGVLLILLDPLPELEGHGLGQAVVNIVAISLAPIVMVLLDCGVFVFYFFFPPPI